MNKPTDMGDNRTGSALSPAASKRAMEAARAGTPDRLVDTGGLELHAARLQWSIESEPVGTMPAPGTLKGAARTAVVVMQGKHPNVFMDHLAARLAFERTGTRLYELLLVKLEAADVHEGGPTREELEAIRNEELQHAVMLEQCIEKLGSDPTVVTPAADVQAAASHGVINVLADPRTTLTQALEAVLIAELTDNDAWSVLSELAAGLGHDEIAARFSHAVDQEQDHLIRVRRWVSAGLLGQAGIEPTRP